MAINQLLVNSYAQNVYRTGMNSMDNIEATRPEYVKPVNYVMIRAAKVYYIEDIDDALTKGWITPQIHADTMALKTPDDKQHHPESLMAQEQA